MTIPQRTLRHLPNDTIGLDDTFRDMHNRIPDVRKDGSVPTGQAQVGAIRVVGDVVYIRGETKWIMLRSNSYLFVSGLNLTYVSASSILIDIGIAIDSTKEHEINLESQLTVSIVTQGLNGLDVGSEASNTFYAVFIIGDSTGSRNPIGLLSLSNTDPILPTGYDIFRRIGWIRNDSSSDIIPFEQRGSRHIRDIFYATDDLNLKLLTDGNAIAFTTVSLASLIPHTSGVAHLAPTFRTRTPGTASDILELTISPGANTPCIFGIGLKSNDDAYFHVSSPVDNNQAIDYRVTSVANRAGIIVLGYKDEI